jgi:phage tail tape-measure protein
LKAGSPGKMGQAIGSAPKQGISTVGSKIGDQ